MKRICFAYDMLFAEKANLNIIEKILLELLEKEAVDCWFNGCHSTFDDQVMEVIMKIRTENPGKALKVIDVIDPIHRSSNTFNVEEEEEEDDFPKGSVDEFLMAPWIEGKAEKNSNYAIIHSRKIEYWIWTQCDYMLAYYYPNLPNRSYSMAQRGRKLKNLEVIEINNDVTKEMIENRIQALQPEEKRLIENKRAGLPYKIIAAEQNISEQLVSQKTRKLIYRIEHQVQRDLKKIENEYPVFPKYAVRLRREEKRTVNYQCQ